jgi:uncharacterized protein (DUF885 family)
MRNPSVFPRLLQWQRMAKVFALIPLIVLGVSCGRRPGGDFERMTEEFVYTTLSFSPAAATSVGLHEFDGKKLDGMLDDFSPPWLDRQKRYYEQFQSRLAALKPESLDAQERADYSILQDQVELALLDLKEVQSAFHNPTVYVETLGNALFGPYMLEYAPKAERFRNIIARLQKVPLFLDQASNNLTASPAIWTTVAAEENEGNISLVDKTLRAAVPAELKDDYENAARTALFAMNKFQDYLKNNLSHRDQAEWRLGSARYARKFRYTLDAGAPPGDILQQAERDLQSVRARMLELALPLHRPGASSAAGTARENQVISEVLDRIAARHSTPESYMDDARKDLEEARQFVAARHLLTLPQRSNLQVIETPEFMRGIYAVGGFNPAPALEPQLGAFYWVTPIPKSWPAERVESKLREYNFYKLKLLTIHEAMPGHYVQGEFANGVEPKSRRLLRAVYGNGPYVEGWAQYATQTMLDEGFLDHSPEMQLTFLKEQLRVLANTILDIRLQTLDMTDQEALDLMQKQTFQEKEEAVAKLQRAKLSSCQLPTYYVGWRGWNRAHDEYRQAKGAGFSLSDFNDRSLRQGAVPLTSLGRLL